MIRNYRWRPDTCGCIIIETHDDEANTWSGVPESKCPAHASVPNQELYGVLHANPDGENKRKNQVHGMFLELDEYRDIDEEGNNVLIAGLQMHYEFTGSGKDRVLEVWFDANDSIHARKANQLAVWEGRSPKHQQAYKDAVAARDKLAQDLETAANKHRNDLHAKFDQQFGPGKVRIR